MKRLEQALLIATFLGFSWLAMQAVHELGHVLGAWLTGAEVIQVALHPLIFSRTDIGHNPHPGIVVWAGPLVGTLLPLGVYLVARAFRWAGLYLYRFFAGFCCIVNGIYIAVFPASGLTDPDVMIQHGSQRWMLVAFGLVMFPLGLCLWHGQGPHFGLGEKKGKVKRGAVVVSACLIAGVVAVELLVGSR